MRRLSVGLICFGAFASIAGVGITMTMTMAQSQVDPVFDISRSIGNLEIERRFDFNESEAVQALAWSPDDRHILVLTNQGSHARVYNVATGHLEHDFYPSQHGVVAKSAFLTNDGLVLATFGSVRDDGKGTIFRLALFDSKTGERIRTYSFAQGAGANPVSVLKFQPSPSGRLVAALGISVVGGRRERPVVIFDTDSGAIRGRIDLASSEGSVAVRSISFFPDESKIAVLLSNGGLAVVGIPTNKVLDRFSVCSQRELSCDKIDVSPSGKLLISSRSSNGSGSASSVGSAAAVPQVRSLPGGAVKSDLLSERPGDTAGLVYASWNPRRDSVAIADSSTINVWDNVSIRPTLTFVRHVPTVDGNLVKYSPDALAYSHSGMLAVGAGSHVLIYR